MAPQVGLEAITERKRTNLQGTDGTLSSLKTVVVHIK